MKDFKFASSNNYYDIHGRIWIPKTHILAVVQISHGMAEYIARYDEFARFLADRGILVVGNDHMGHGQSINSEEDLGYFSIPIKGMHPLKKKRYTSSALAVKDLYHVTKIVKKHYPGVPYILLGHSMGSFLVRRYLMEYGHEVDAAIIMGTGNQSKFKVNMGLVLCKIISLVMGERYRSELLNNIIFGLYNKRISSPIGKSDWVTSDEEHLKKYYSDEKCGFVFTMNGIHALLSTIKYIQKKENIEKIPTDVKMIFLAGLEDPVGRYGEEVKEVYEIYTKHGVKNISIKLYDGCRHELLNETIRENVYTDIYKWIENTVIYGRE